MNIFSIIGIGVVGCMITVLLKVYQPEFSIHASIITSVILLASVLAALGGAVSDIVKIADKYSIDTVYIGTVMRIIGIAYICQFAADVCRDSGQNAIAAKIDLAAKVLILLYAIPIVNSLLSLIVSILP